MTEELQSPDVQLALILEQLATSNNVAKNQQLIACLYAIGLKPDSEKMLQWYKLSASNGNADSQYCYAVEALRLHHDEKDAMYWLKLSAERGNRNAQYEMAKRDQENRIKWLTLCAENGHIKAMYDLAITYFETSTTGRPTQEQFTEMFKWFTMYIDKCDVQMRFASAHSYLAVLYDIGVGTEKDSVMAFLHYQKAIIITEEFNRPYICQTFQHLQNEGIEEIYEQVGNMYFDGNGIEQDYKKAHYHYMKAITKDRGQSLYKLSIMYRNKLGVDVDTKQADDYLLKAVKAGYTDAEYDLGTNCYNTWKKTSDYDDTKDEFEQRVITYLTRATVKNHVDACITLGLFYWYKEMYQESFNLFSKAQCLTENDQRPNVIYYLARMYHRGLHVDKDYEYAIKLYQVFLTKFTKEQRDDMQMALHDPGFIYEDWLLKQFNYSLEEAKKDTDKAIRCCKILAENNNIIAMFILGLLYWKDNEKEGFKWYSKALLADKDDDLRNIRAESKSFENEIMMKRLSRGDEVDGLKEELQDSKKQLDDLRKEMSKLTTMIGVLKKE